MSFVSGTFLLFLPLAVFFFWRCPAKRRWIVLLTASLIFCLGWEAVCVVLLLNEITAAWICCLIVEKHKERWLFAALLALLFLPLVGYKYSAFLIHSFSAVLGLDSLNAGMRSYALPVGISFYTFQAVSCVIDVYRGEEKAERNLFRFALFVSFFPQLVAGPIERAGALMPQLRQEKRFSFQELCDGTRLVLTGFFQKICAADALAPVVDRIFAMREPDGSMAMLGAALFSFQIYFDFAGYAAIAMGCARMMGIRLTRNFRSPYTARSLRDFWRRWHITLNQWFQTYVYLPLGGSKHGPARQILASCAVFMLSGLWHGADWTFVCWGACHGVFYTVEMLMMRYISRPRDNDRRRWGMAYTLIIVTLTWVLFRAESMTQAAAMYRAMISPWHIQAAWASLSMNRAQLLTLLISIAAAFRLECWGYGDRQKLPQTWSVTVGVIVLISVSVCWLAHLNAGMQNTFIYFQF